MLLLQMDVDLWDISSPADMLQTSIFNLVLWAEKSGKVSHLVVAAHQANPNNPALREFFDVVWSQQTPHKENIFPHPVRVYKVARVRARLDGYKPLSRGRWCRELTDQNRYRVCLTRRAGDVPGKFGSTVDYCRL